jgi:hypothetical protein
VTRRAATGIALAGLALAAIGSLSACAPRLLPAPPEAHSVTQTWHDNRDRYRTVSALADVTVDADDVRLAWPEFTAVFAYHDPDRVALSGFSPLGQLLFTYEAGGGRYTLRGPDLDRARSGSLGDAGAGPEARVLGALVHLVDGMLGPDTAGAPVGVARDGRWVVRARGETLTLDLDDGRIDTLEVRRRGGAAVALAFDDWRDAGPLEAPYGIEVRIAAGGLTAEIRIDEWRLEGSPEAAGKAAPALTAGRNSPYLDVPRPGPADGPLTRFVHRPPPHPWTAEGFGPADAFTGG